MAGIIPQEFYRVLKFSKGEEWNKLAQITKQSQILDGLEVQERIKRIDEKRWMSKIFAVKKTL